MSSERKPNFPDLRFLSLALKLDIKDNIVREDVFGEGWAEFPNDKERLKISTNNGLVKMEESKKTRTLDFKKMAVSGVAFAFVGAVIVSSLFPLIDSAKSRVDDSINKFKCAISYNWGNCPIANSDKPIDISSHPLLSRLTPTTIIITPIIDYRTNPGAYLTAVAVNP
jgi:hypothetical protein